ncbi:MAG TPA: glycosyltransferase family 2 protein [Gemmatimonadaceae bacterium]
MPDTQFGVVMINWNGAEDTIPALDSLVAATPRPDRVVLIDNGSEDNSLMRLRAWCDAKAPSWNESAPLALDNIDNSAWLLLITADSNLGFSGANNVGLRYLAKSTSVTHMLLLNNDATVAPDFFAEMANAIHDWPHAGLLGCLIYRHPQRDQIWFAGSKEIPWRALINHVVDAPGTNDPFPARFVTGCAMVISRALYDAEGGMAEVYNPIYWEDADYSHRAIARGWRPMVVPRALVYHRVGASGSGERLTPRTAFLQNRNRAIYVRRNYRGPDRLLALGYLCATKPARAVVEIARGHGPLGSAIVRGFWRGMTQRLA